MSIIEQNIWLYTQIEQQNMSILKEMTNLKQDIVHVI
jgi:hypothetical protein